MKRIYVLLTAMTASMALEADEPLGLLGSQQYTIESTNVSRKAWKRSVVMTYQDGNITGDDGVVGEKASTDAIDILAAESYRVSTEANNALMNSMQYVYSATNSMAPNCVMTTIHLAPETSRSNLTAYVVKTVTSSGVDRQWVWYNRVLAMKPNRYVTYSYLDQSENVKANWVNWTTNGVSVTVDGKTWDGCHECTVARPSFALGETCIDLPNEVWGGPSGMDFGDMLLTRRGIPHYTGFVTNGISGDVIYFDNGFYKPNPNQ